MRYDDAQIYESKTVPGLRYLIEEIPGFALCKGAQGLRRQRHQSPAAIPLLRRGG